MTKGKGSGFEREICKTLSLWWTYGVRNDVFWRSAGSGAMATTRGKRSQSAFGQDGDIQATDPSGQPFVNVFCVEVKRGYSKTSFADLLDRPEKAAPQMWDKFIQQAVRSQLSAKAKYWMLIAKRDRRETLVAVPYKAAFDLGLHKKRIAQVRAAFHLKLDNKLQKTVLVFILTLNDFIENALPSTVERWNNEKSE